MSLQIHRGYITDIDDIVVYVCQATVLNSLPRLCLYRIEEDSPPPQHDLMHDWIHDLIHDVIHDMMHDMIRDMILT